MPRAASFLGYSRPCPFFGDRCHQRTKRPIIAIIVSGSNRVSIQINNYGTLKNKITAIKADNTISRNKLKDITDCIDEIETTIDSGRKQKFSFQSLVELTLDFSSIGSLVIELKKLIFDN